MPRAIVVVVVASSLLVLASSQVRAQGTVGMDIGPAIDRWEDGTYHPDARLEALIPQLARDGVESVRLDIHVLPGETAKLEAYRAFVKKVAEWSGGKVKVHALLDRVIVPGADAMHTPVVASGEETAESAAWIKAYSDQAAFLATELGREGVVEFELINEPNNWSLPAPDASRPWMSPSNYGRAMARATEAIHAARRAAGESRATIVSGPLVVDDTWDRADVQTARLVEYMAAARSAGWPDRGPPFDFVGVHPYLAQVPGRRTPDEGDETLRGYLDGVLAGWLPALASAAGDAAIRFKATEVGAPIADGDRDRQAWIVAQLLGAFGRQGTIAGVEAFHSFDFGDKGYGLFDWSTEPGEPARIAPRPAYAPIKDAAQLSPNAAGLPLPAPRSRRRRDPVAAATVAPAASAEGSRPSKPLGRGIAGALSRD